MKSAYFVLAVVLLSHLTVTTVNSKPASALSEDRLVTTAVGSGPSGKTAGGPYEAFISYRRSVSKHLAMLIKVLLTERKRTGYLDVEDLKAGYWDDQLMQAINTSPNFIFILSNGTLDRCIGDTDYKDVVHQEIREAVQKKRNIIPVFDSFTMPDAKFSPEINEMMRFQGVEWNHGMVDESMKKLTSYFKL